MIDLPGETEKLLKKWNGGEGSLWQYSSSFQRLSIRLKKQEMKGNLFIICSPLISIHADKIFWNKLDLHISIEKTNPLLGSTFLIEDHSNGLEIRCMGLHFKEITDEII